MGFFSRFGVPGEKVDLLAFGDGFTNIEIKKGWTRYSQYLKNGSTMEGCEINEAKPLSLISGGKVKGHVIPVDFDKGQGITFSAPKTEPSGTYIEKKKIGTREDGSDIIQEYHVEVYPGVPLQDKSGPVGFMRMIKFRIDPIQARIGTNPKLIGHTTESEILSNAIRLKPMRWQLIATALIMFLLGYAF